MALEEPQILVAVIVGTIKLSYVRHTILRIWNRYKVSMLFPSNYLKSDA